MLIDLKSFVNVGQSATIETIVSKEDTAANYGTGRLGDILATPALVKWMIKAAVEAVDPHLPEGLVSVGLAMQFQHTAPSLIGAIVRVKATVTDVSENSVIFDISANDDIGEICIGRYERMVVILDELLRKANSRGATLIKSHP